MEGMEGGGTKEGELGSGQAVGRKGAGGRGGVGVGSCGPALKEDRLSDCRK